MLVDFGSAVSDGVEELLTSSSDDFLLLSRPPLSSARTSPSSVELEHPFFGDDDFRPRVRGRRHLEFCWIGVLRVKIV